MKPTIEDSILSDKNVGRALRMLRQRMEKLSITEGIDQMSQIETDYNLMCDCFERGMRDSKGEDVYNDLLRRIYKLYNTIRLASIVKHRNAYASMWTIGHDLYGHDTDVRKTLEEFVQETVMASLLPENEQRAILDKTHEMHMVYVGQLFNYLVVSEQWGEEKACYYKEMLLSPTIDQNDAALIVSGITMSLLTVFDVNKWLTLVAVYENSSVEMIRQRALVGFVLSLPGREMMLFDEVESSIVRLCANMAFRHEFLELQLQLLHCVQTEADNAEIQRDIMPTLIKNNNFKLTRSGIEEKDNSSLEDILDSGAADKNMLEFEEKMNKMADMQKNGSDIYFGGFSHMKRFRFFNAISNWFVPFYTEHPLVADALHDAKTAFVGKAVMHAPFCDSDKYSFVFALSSVCDRLPGSVKEMMASGSNFIAAETSVDKGSPAYIRRMYLQNLYRFFNLYRDKADFANPFSATVVKEDGSESMRVMFMENSAFARCLVDEYTDLARFLFKRQQFKMVISLVVLRRSINRASESELLLLAHSYMRLGLYAEASDVFVDLGGCDSGNMKVAKGYADSLFMLRKYAEASEAYSRVVENNAGNKRCLLYRSLSLINSGREKDGMADLYRLYYENETDADVRRALAWGCLMDNKPQEAERIYDSIISGGKCVVADFLNCGYAKWILSKVSEAVALFRKYKSEDAGTTSDSLNEGAIHSILDDFNADGAMLDKYGIKDYEKTIMLDIML